MRKNFSGGAMMTIISMLNDLPKWIKSAIEEEKQHVAAGNLEDAKAARKHRMWCVAQIKKWKAFARAEMANGMIYH